MAPLGPTYLIHYMRRFNLPTHALSTHAWGMQLGCSPHTRRAGRELLEHQCAISYFGKSVGVYQVERG